MRQRYSSDYLRHLRNDIPIPILIADILEVPAKVSEGYFRFRCPLCAEFNTASNPGTNLARCFRCKINFNTIEMVMTVNRCNFLEAVRFLKDYQRVK